VIRAVIDANVLVLGLLSPAGNEALIVLAIHQGLIRPCFSDAMMQEYADVLARPKFSFEPDAIAAALAMVRDNGELVVARTVARDLPDPDDAKFVHCAETAQAQYLVTGNKRHFPPEACGTVRVVSAGELLDRITLEI
jgi:uncharacterized protein